MSHAAPPPAEALACALAMIVAANGCIDEKELSVLDRLDAFRSVGVTRERFVEIAHTCMVEVGEHLRDRSWLSADQVRYIDARLDAVTEHGDRRLVCRLAAAVIAADGCVTHDERLIHDHALAHWRIESPSSSP